MSDSTTQDTAEKQSPTPNDVPAKKPDTPTQDKTPAGEKGTEATDWKREARKWEERAKNNLADAEAYRALKEAEKTDLERTQDQLAERDKQIEELTRQQMVSNAVIEYGISKQFAHLVKGSTQDEINEAAKSVAELQGEREGIVPGSATTGGKDTAGSSLQAGRERYAARRTKNRKD